MQSNEHVEAARQALSRSESGEGNAEDRGQINAAGIAANELVRANALAGLAIAEELRGVREELGRLARRSA